MMIRALALSALLLPFSAPAFAQDFGDDYYVTASVGSHHFEERSPGRDYNESNPGIGFEMYQTPFYDFGQNTPVRTFLAAGYYHNSIDKPSVYATGGIEVCHSPNGADFAACTGVLAGAVTGYYYTVSPAAVGYVKLQYDDLYVKGGIIPPVHGSDTSVPTTLLLQLGYRFN